MFNNETFGLTIEKSICDIFDLTNNIDYKRTNLSVINEIKPIIKKYLEEQNIIPIEYIGNNGNCHDFLLNNQKYLQVKSNYNLSDKVCPPVIGQCTKRTFLLNIARKINPFIELDDNLAIKQFIFNNIKQIFIMYMNSYFTSDYILYIKKYNEKIKKKIIIIINIL